MVQAVSAVGRLEWAKALVRWHLGIGPIDEATRMEVLSV